VTVLIAKLKELRLLASPADGKPPAPEQVRKMRDLANQIEAIALGPVDEEGRIGKPPVP
jgi:hypothetical protein